MTAAVLTLAGVLVLVVALGAWLAYELVRQQGRLVLRIDALEQRLGLFAGGGAAAEPSGLAVGTEVAPFAAPDLDGTPVRLEDFRGERVLLVHWSPGCGFCDVIASELAELDAPLRAARVRLLLLARGDMERNRALAEEHGLKAPILLIADGSPAADVFENEGTPVAYLLDGEGKVAEPLAVGAEQVPALARRLAGPAGTGAGGEKRGFGTRSLEGSRIVRDGLKAGTPAPTFTLPDLLGRGDVALESYRGRQVLLVFSDPHCGPCEMLAPQLAELSRQHAGNGLSLILVGRGDAEENRRKARELGYDFPVVLQDKWELSKEYGIFATPVGFLIDERGVIARDVAKGPGAVLALAPRPAAAEA